MVLGPPRRNLNGNNRYLAFKIWKANHPNEPFVYQPRKWSKQKVAETIELYGFECAMQMEYEATCPRSVDVLPKPKKSKRLKTRSDKGKKHKKKSEFELPHSMTPAVLNDPTEHPLTTTFAEEQQALKDTLEEIEYWKYREEKKLAEKSTVRIASRKRQQHVYDANSRAVQKWRNKLHEGISVTNKVLKNKKKRELCIPPDRICILCQLNKQNNKQWCILTFKTSENAICKACYDHIRIEYFSGNVKNCRDFFKLCEYSMLKEELQHVRN